VAHPGQYLLAICPKFSNDKFTAADDQARAFPAEDTPATPNTPAPAATAEGKEPGHAKED